MQTTRAKVRLLVSVVVLGMPGVGFFALIEQHKNFDPYGYLPKTAKIAKIKPGTKKCNLGLFERKGEKAVIFADLDGDRKKEATLFYTIWSWLDGRFMGGSSCILVLKKDGKKYKKLWEDENKAAHDFDPLSGVWDVNRDGKPEMVVFRWVGASFGGYLDIYQWNGSTFAKLNAKWNDIQGVEFKDVDGDEVDEIKLTHRFSVPNMYKWKKDKYSLYEDGPYPVSASKSVPRMQVIPMPYHQASFQRDGAEIARYHFGPALNRPFLFPVIGPSGRSLTRMGHPHDPQSHSHHNSVWISHHDVNGIDFWSDQGGGKIHHIRIVRFEDGNQCASIVTQNQWRANNTKVLLVETRRITALPLDNREWLLIIDMEFTARDSVVTLGKTPFGMIGVRMAKTIGVNDGGGVIRNSEEAVNEKQVFWKRAKWVDYSGPIADKILEGITLFDHPNNPNFPSHFHVRNDGWMGASLTFEGPQKVEPGKSLYLCYGLYVHSDIKLAEAIEAKWQQFTKTHLTSLASLIKQK